MSRLVIILSLFLLLPSLTIKANIQQIDTVDYLVKMNLKAMGGKKNLERIKTVVRIRGSANMITVARIKPSHGSLIILVDTNTWKIKFAEGRYAKTSWEQWGNDSKRKVVTGRPDSALWATAQNPTGYSLPLYRTRSAGHKIQYVGRERIESINYFKILVTLSGRSEGSYYYINPVSFLIERNRGVRRHHAYDQNEKYIETIWKDFRKVNGVTTSFIEMERDIDTGERLSGGRPSPEISFNIPVDDIDFTTAGSPDKWIQYLKDFHKKRKQKE